MTLTAEQRRRVAWILEGYLSDDDPDTFEERAERQLALLTTPQEWFLWASESPANLQPAEWRRVLDSPLCDQGTALLVYWRNSPHSFYRDEPAGRLAAERLPLVMEIERRTTAGDWPSAVVRFDPAAFKGGRINFLRDVPAGVLARIPTVMTQPNPGEPVPPLGDDDYDWGEGF